MEDKIRLIIDTDPGIDDAIAIAIALFSEKVDLKLISTVSGNVTLDKVTYNARKLLKFFNKDNIPIAKGNANPLIEKLNPATNVHGLSGMDGYDFEEPTKEIVKSHAVVEMKKIILESDKKTTILAIGPLTNVALLLSMYPEVKSKIDRIVFMGGSLTRGNHRVMSEFNISTDPEAAYMVIHSGVKVEMVGLDIAYTALILPEDSEKIRGKNKTGEMVYALFKKYRGGSFNSGLKMYDATALAYILNPDLFEKVDTYLDIELNGNYTKGCTIVDLKGYLKKSPNATVLTAVKDATKFRSWFIEALGKCI